MCHWTVGQISDLMVDIEGIDPNRHYKDDEHIVCVQSKAGTGICAFLQHTGGLQGKDVRPLLGMLRDHGCDRCGSIPLGLPQGDNDDNKYGILTVNYVFKTNCNGLCE